MKYHALAHLPLDDGMDTIPLDEGVLLGIPSFKYWCVR